MEFSRTRRQFLALGATAGTVGTFRSTAAASTGTANAAAATPRDGASTTSPVDVRGAIYIPTRAFNRYQMWRDYDPAEIERDLGYAASLNLNAVRTWLSYEYWLRNPRKHAEALEHLLDTAEEYGIRVLLGVFDGVGEEPTYFNLVNDDLRTAVQTHSPSSREMRDPDLWDRPRRFVRWFMDRYRDDDRLLAIELTNEPGWDPKDVRFARGMAETLTRHRGSVPLTIGATSLVTNVDYHGWGFDVLQFHYNFPRTPEIYEGLLDRAKRLSNDLDKPIWLTEWQRVRSGERFFSDVSGTERFPNYSSLAPTIREAGVGNFFWSLMLKPAFALGLREMGVVNGVFHEDGAVWSRDDARTIKSMSGDASLDREVRTEYPEWLAPLKRWSGGGG